MTVSLPHERRVIAGYCCLSVDVRMHAAASTHPPRDVTTPVEQRPRERVLPSHLGHRKFRQPDMGSSYA